MLLLNDPEEKVKEGDYEDLLFIRKIPEFNDNPLQKGIENLFKKDLIDKVKNNFPDDFGFFTQGSKIKDFKICSNKQGICDWICKNGKEEDFANFKDIFKIIDKALINKKPNK